MGAVLEYLRAGPGDAPADIVQGNGNDLNVLANRQFEAWIRHKIDPESVVQSVFGSFFRRFQDGQFHFEQWDNLWTLLFTLTLRKYQNRRAYSQAVRRDPRRGAAPPMEIAAPAGAPPGQAALIA